MRALTTLWAGALIALTFVCACEGNETPEPTPGIVRLSSGDSVEVVAVGPALVPDAPAGLLVTFHPFFSPETDTLRVRRVAEEMWRAKVKPTLRPPLPAFTVLQATSLRAGQISEYTNAVTYGIVLNRREDGQWYRLGTGERID